MNNDGDEESDEVGVQADDDDVGVVEDDEDEGGTEHASSALGELNVQDDNDNANDEDSELHDEEDDEGVENDVEDTRRRIIQGDNEWWKMAEHDGDGVKK